MQTTDIAPHMETLKRALGPKLGAEVTPEKLEQELTTYLEYGVPAEQAIKTILRHYEAPGGMAPTAPAQGAKVTLAELTGNLPAVDLKARVLTRNTKIVQARGQDKEIVWGMLGDETGTAAYTSWRPLDGIEKGDCVEIQSAYTKEFRGEVQINFGDRARVEKLPDDAVGKVPTNFKDIQIGEITEGMRGLRVTGRILDVSSREVTVQGTPKTIWGGTVADTSGKIEFTSWHDHNIVADSVVTIEGGYVRSYRGTPQLNFDEDANVTKAEADLPDANALDQAALTTLGEIIVRGGGNDVAVVATLLEVREGSGLIFRDPETNRVVPGGTKADGARPDLRIKAVLDDGTGAVSIIAGREITEALLGKDLDACLAEVQAAFHPGVIEDQLKAKLVGRVWKARGNVLSDDFGLSFLVRSLEPFSEDVEKAAEELLGNLPPEAF